RRHRLDPRRLLRRVDRRRRGYGGPHLPAARPAPDGRAQHRRRGWPGARLDADLPLHGRGARVPSPGPVPGAQMSARTIAVGSLVAALLLLPVVTAALGEPFYVTLATRILVFA